ncbi:retrotransposon protein, putative, ty1-copia subclass [Tanacetum coccineum]
MYVIEQPIPPTPASDSAANVLVEWNAVYDAYNEVACLMLKKEEGKPAAAYVLKMKGYVEQLECLGYVLPQDLKYPAKDDTCHHCKEEGHWKRNCPIYLAELLKKKKFVMVCFYLIKLNIKSLKIQGVLFKNEVERHVQGLLSRPSGFDMLAWWRSNKPSRFKDYLKACGIVQQLTPPYTPQHNVTLINNEIVEHHAVYKKLFQRFMEASYRQRGKRAERDKEYGWTSVLLTNSRVMVVDSESGKS